MHSSFFMALGLGFAVASQAAAPAQAPAASTPDGTTRATTSVAAPEAGPAAIATATPTSTCCRIPAGTPVRLELTETLYSEKSMKGQTFGLALRRPIVVDGVTLVPAGATGMGEVIHAERSRGGGKPGELVLAARWIQHGGVRLPLRGMSLLASGEDNSTKALGMSVAIGVFAAFIKGGEIFIPLHTEAGAKVAQDVFLPPPAAATSTDARATAPVAADAGATPPMTGVSTPENKE